MIKARFQFRLPTLFWVMTYVCLMCALVPACIRFHVTVGPLLILLATIWFVAAWDASG